VWQEINYKEDSNDLLVPNITYRINPAEIESIEDNSIAQEIGFESGDSIISINGKKPRDLIDYQILISEEILDISVLDKNHEIHNISIEKDQDVNLGINFKDALFDSIKQCNNKCPFCFIDQQPSGKRKSLYIKDDDYRLSFLYGSYLTLTNLKKEDWERISTQKLSPLFISVHATDPETREKLAKKIFKVTSDYDKKIFDFLSKNEEQSIMPSNLDMKLSKISDLRYGENPHQIGAVYSDKKNGVANSTLLHGKAMSYLNYLDADAAFTAANSFPDNCVSIIKHTNSCGLSYHKNQVEAYKLALRGDPVSAFGGIIGLNSELQPETALEISKIFYEVIIAPSFSKEALEILTAKKNIRLIKSTFDDQTKEYRTINGGVLYQEKDNFELDTSDWEFVTKNKPKNEDMENLIFAWNSTKFIKSNAIVITENNSIIGIGAGQPNRVNSVNLAAKKAEDHLTENSILASDAFFPFSDSIDLANKYNIKTIIQPGGSIRDNEVIEKADEFKIKMIFTNQRHFSH